ncbi:hippurate hydrolase [Corynebacterium sp. HMSC034B08]|uniref:M20 metallopeptidase family protein n=1 Tax=Corynebacterium TaxID=1716 RepID=UPI0008A96ED4|nr:MULTISPECIES: M20 family metallopeptidase [Corynebacterium]OHO32530.1 hippurate hydrolase [Corynebacterium sp. HMSC034E11]OHO33140.1 hippurate hydrolase [Corynebacterium sp. HMSC034B08]UBI09091.1 amidohydrolase [Corynebacterium coyleae]
MRENLQQLAEQWVSEFNKYLSDVVELRKQIHSSPFVSGEEQPTTDLMIETMSVRLEPVAQTGAVGRIGPTEGASIGIRGELDALPVTEETGVEWSSTNDAMHACGHDVHLAALAGVIRAAKNLDLPYGLVPILQPREETYPSGALDIAESGKLQQLGVRHVIGAHVHPSIPTGAVAAGSGFVNAAAGEIAISVTGKGGHGAYPHNGCDAAVPTAQIAVGISEVVRRIADPMSPALVSIGTIAVGQGAANVLPRSGRIFATVRSTTSAINEHIVEAIRTMATGIATGYGCTVNVEYKPGEPELVNAEVLSEKFDAYAASLGIANAETMRSMGADDFSFYGEICPSLMCFVGVADSDNETASLHDPSFLPSDEALSNVGKTMIAGYIAAAEAISESEG